jgi:hypothetical protein
MNVILKIVFRINELNIFHLFANLVRLILRCKIIFYFDSLLSLYFKTLQLII